MKKSVLGLVAGLLLAGVVSAMAGMWSTLPQATSSPTTGNATTLPLTGNETGAFDTNLSGGRNPQTETISVDQLKTYMYGNGGQASATPNTTGTATGDATTSGAASCNTSRCMITSQALTTLAGDTYTLTLSNSSILADSIVLATVGMGTNTISNVHMGEVTLDVDSEGAAARITVQNMDPTSALNGTLRIGVVVIN